MLSDILPLRMRESFQKLNFDSITELRFRVGQPIMVLMPYPNYLGKQGIQNNTNDCMFATAQDLEDIVYQACEFSVYAHNDEIKQSFISLRNGIRIGVCGEIVSENSVVKSIKNYNSINIRIPHIVKNCSLNILTYLYQDETIYNTLIFSAPGCGKTTMLRDVASQFCEKKLADNILIIDERNEIAGTYLNKNIDTSRIDIMKNCSKEYGVVNGIRTMSPSVIFVDEIANTDDTKCLNYAIGSGVSFVATTHSQNIFTLQKKPLFKEILQEKMFDRYVQLSNRNGIGTIDGVYDKDFNCLYLGG